MAETMVTIPAADYRRLLEASECDDMIVRCGTCGAWLTTDEAAVTDDFTAFPKVPRLNREVLITEKIDGTNAQVFISEDGTEIRAGSRNRWITLDADNMGFARWVEDHRDDLLTLGPREAAGLKSGLLAFRRPKGAGPFTSAEACRSR